MKNLNQMAYAADAAGLALRSLAPTSVRPRRGALSTDILATGTDSAPPGILMV